MRAGVLLVVLAACGGGQRQTAQPVAKDTENSSDSMASPETMEEVQRVFRSRQGAVVNCYGEASMSGKLTKPRARGRVTVVSRITTAGKATNVRVSETSLGEPIVEECIVEKVATWDLPKPEVDFDFSFTYELSPD